MGLIACSGKQKMLYTKYNSCNLLRLARDLFLEPIHKRQLIQLQVVRITSFWTLFQFLFDIPNDESCLNFKVQ